MDRKRILIMGAAGRDFHNFNVVFRSDPDIEVAAFTAAQIPDIEGRVYPPELAGPRYPQGIPIHPEEELVRLVRSEKIDEVVFAYSDVSHETVMHKAAIVNGAGADFVLLGCGRTMLKSSKPVVAVCAVRTGAGKSQTTRRVSEILRAKGRNVVAVRHPMPYGDLVRQKVQRFAEYADMDRNDCTIEEREEYEPHIDMGNIVYAGVDYEAILRQAEKEADVILWDGGNNDTPFYRPDLWITVADPHRPGHETSYYPGETNFRQADILIINKVDTADPENVASIRAQAGKLNPDAIVIEADSPIAVDEPSLIENRRVLVVEDGPTLTHGGMTYGAGVVAARQFGASEIVDPRLWVTGRIRETYDTYPGIGRLLPAMGYGEDQIHDLEQTIRDADCDTVVIGTPIDLTKIVRIDKPTVRVRYNLSEKGGRTLDHVLAKF